MCVVLWCVCVCVVVCVKTRKGTDSETRNRMMDGVWCHTCRRPRRCPWSGTLVATNTPFRRSARARPALLCGYHSCRLARPERMPQPYLVRPSVRPEQVTARSSLPRRDTVSVGDGKPDHWLVPNEATKQPSSSHTHTLVVGALRALG